MDPLVALAVVVVHQSQSRLKLDLHVTLVLVWDVAVGEGVFKQAQAEEVPIVAEVT